MDSHIDFELLLRRYVGRIVSISTYGHIKLVGRVASVHDECVRMIDCQLLDELEDQGWYSKIRHSDPENHLGPSDPESLVRLSSILAITCLDDGDGDLLSPEEFARREQQAARKKKSLKEAEKHARQQEWNEAFRGQQVLDEKVDLLDKELLQLHLGAGLIRLADAKQAGDLLDRISAMRKSLAEQTGFEMPLVRVRDDLSLDQQDYRISVVGCETGRGRLDCDRLLAIEVSPTDQQLAGPSVAEPVFGRPAVWIEKQDREQAELAGHLVVEPSVVLATHLSNIVRSHAGELLTYDHTARLLDQLADNYPELTRQARANASIGTIQTVLKQLLEERVSIRNLRAIVESLVNCEAPENDTGALLARVRERIGRSVCQDYRDEEGVIHALALHSALELQLADALVQTPDGNPDDFEGSIACWADRIIELAGGAYRTTPPVVLVADQSLRRSLWQILSRHLPDICVMAKSEIPRDVTVRPLAVWGTETWTSEQSARQHELANEELSRRLPR